jgi:hypothetical protein
MAPFSSDFVPVAISAATATATKASQTAIARHGRRVLQRPIVATDLVGRV